MSKHCPERHKEGASNTQCRGGGGTKARGRRRDLIQRPVGNRKSRTFWEEARLGCWVPVTLRFLVQGWSRGRAHFGKKSLGCVHRTCAHFCRYIIHLQMFTDLKTSAPRKQQCTFYKKKIDLHTGEWSGVGRGRELVTSLPAAPRHSCKWLPCVNSRIYFTFPVALWPW